MKDDDKYSPFASLGAELLDLDELIVEVARQIAVSRKQLDQLATTFDLLAKAVEAERSRGT